MVINLWSETGLNLTTYGLEEGLVDLAISKLVGLNSLEDLGELRRALVQRRGIVRVGVTNGYSVS